MPVRLPLLASAAIAAVLACAPGAQAGQPPAGAAAVAALERAEDARRGKGPGGRELTLALAELFRALPALGPAERKRAEALLARPTDGAADQFGDGYTVPSFRHCTAHFCVHWVESTADAPALADGDGDDVPDYVELTASVLEDEVYACENGTAAGACAEGAEPGLGWQEAPSDATAANNGGDGRIDAYIADLFADGIYGYVALDPSQGSDPSVPHWSYMVLDKDYSRFATGSMGPDDPLRVTAAHEYNHVLQNGYDYLQDVWMFESTATWVEEKVYPSVDDYLQYLPDWVANTAQPLTEGSSSNLKIYGSAVWNHWLESRHGPGSIETAWDDSATVLAPLREDFAPDAYTSGITAFGGSGFVDEFNRFSAAAAEWRVPGSGFPDTYPDVPRAASLATGGTTVSRSLDHTTFDLLSVQLGTPAPPFIRLSGTLPAGLKGAVALVGRTGTADGGTATRQLAQLASGGTTTVDLADPAVFSRITAVLSNADPAVNEAKPWHTGRQDWNWTKDNQTLTARVLAPPGTATTAATGVAATGATLAGLVNPYGQATTYRFEYGTTTAYGQQAPATPASAGSGTTAAAVTTPVTGLAPATTYHYRVVATNATGTSTSEDRTFTTSASAAPAVVTGAASGISGTAATLNGTVEPNGGATTWRFEYGTTTAYGSATSSQPVSGPGPQPVSAPLSGLTPGTTYHYRLVATSPGGTAHGDDATFTTPALPTAVTDPASGLTSTGATLNASINPNGTATSYRFEYGPTASYGSFIPVSPAAAGSGSAVVQVAEQLTGLTPGSTVHFRIVATSAGGTQTGADRSFTTPVGPTAATGAATGLTGTGATLTGSLNPNGAAATYQFEYGTTTGYGSTAPLSPAPAGSGTVAVEVDEQIAALTPGTTYHFRLKAVNANGTALGDDMTFTTPALPEAVTTAATALTGTGARLNGTVDPNGTATTYRFEYGTTTAYGSFAPADPADAGSGTAPAVVGEDLAGLEPGTTYHYRLVATSAGGVSEGQDQEFTTPLPPGATTEPATAVTQVEAVLNALVDANGSATTYQFEYGPSTAYGSAAPAKPAAAGAGPDVVQVSESIAGLAPATTYHFRVLAVSAGGTTAGADRTFTTAAPPDGGGTGTGTGAGTGTGTGTLTGTTGDGATGAGTTDGTAPLAGKPAAPRSC